MTHAPARDELRELRTALRDLHKSLLDAERLVYEKAFGRIGSDFYLLQIAAEDPQFAWLKSLSTEMIRLDALIGQPDSLSDAGFRLYGARIRWLLLPAERAAGFQHRYQMAMQEHPTVIMAHAAVMRALPPAMRVPFFTGGQEPGVEEYGDLRVVMHRPGSLVPGHGDQGYGPLALVAESTLPPGGEVRMNEHRNEEIVSWVPEGVMRHNDLVEGKQQVDADHLLVMNTGRGYSHAERTLADDPPLRMLQLFVRPTSLDLEPQVQFGGLLSAEAGTWRPLVGPEEGDAPFYVRNAIEIHDGRFAAGMTGSLPQQGDWHRYLFVYSGAILLDGVHLGASGSVLVPSGEQVEFRVEEDATLLSILLDPSARVTRAGTVGR